MKKWFVNQNDGISLEHAKQHNGLKENYAKKEYNKIRLISLTYMCILCLTYPCL